MLISPTRGKTIDTIQDAIDACRRGKAVYHMYKGTSTETLIKVSSVIIK